MKEVLCFFRKKMILDHAFYLGIGAVVLIVSTILYPRYAWIGRIMALSVLMILICLFLYLFKVIGVHVILAKADDIKNGDYKMIDKAVFTQENIYAYTYRQLRKMAYKDIVSVSHMENIFETARPGYRGNHKVICKSSDDVIALAVENGEIADRIMNFLASKNAQIILEHAPKQRVDVQLCDLANHQVKGRF